MEDLEAPDEKFPEKEWMIRYPKRPAGNSGGFVQDGDRASVNGIKLECNPGWFPLVRDLHDKLETIRPGYTVYQVKEKFGGLRYYTDYVEGDDEFQAAIRAAEVQSVNTCEISGLPGKLMHKGYWWGTRNPELYPEWEEDNVG